MSNLPARHLNLAGATNFRDLGGYPSTDGGVVRWRQIFRSNHLGNLTDDDIAVLRQLGIKTAFDFRGAQERLAAMCKHDGITVHSLAIEPITVETLRERLRSLDRDPGRMSPDIAREVMQDSYRKYVRGNAESYRQLFAHLIEDRAPLIIHCTAGKDRTGFAAALILRALGVAEDVILDDYLLTNSYFRIDPAITSDLPDEARAVIGAVEASFLAAAFEAINADYGDLETFFATALGVGPRERAELKTRYLEA